MAEPLGHNVTFFMITIQEIEEWYKLLPNLKTEGGHTTDAQSDPIIEAQLEFGVRDIGLRSRDVADFFLLFEQVFAAAKTAKINLERVKKANLAGVFEDILPPPPSDKSIAITRISYNSPLEVVFAASALGIVLALIISGGEIELSKGKLKAKLPSLGSGIAALRRAMSADRRYLDALRSFEEDWNEHKMRGQLQGLRKQVVSTKGLPRKKPKQNPEA